MQTHSLTASQTESSLSKMKIILTIIWLGCICACCADTKIEQLLSNNTKELQDTKLILSHIDATNKQIKAGIEQQQTWLLSIKNVNELLEKLNQFLAINSAKVLDTLNNIELKSGQQTARLSKELAALALLQLSTKQQILGLEQKMEAYQKHVLINARSIDNNINELSKLITRAVLPQLNGLHCSFDRLETSQINVEVELKSLERIKDVTDHTKGQLSVLGANLASLNRTQNAGLSILTAAVRQLKPLNSWNIESALRELIISQKRIELDLEACEKRSSSIYESSDSYSQSYDLPQSNKQEHTWLSKQPNYQPHSSSSFYASAFAAAPQSNPKPKPANSIYGYQVASPAKPSTGHSVSWKAPLPWETASGYQSVPGPKSSRSGLDRKRPAPNAKYSANPRSGSPQQYQQYGSQTGQAISWYSVSSQ